MSYLNVVVCDKCKTREETTGSGSSYLPQGWDEVHRIRPSGLPATLCPACLILGNVLLEQQDQERTEFLKTPAHVPSARSWSVLSVHLGTVLETLNDLHGQFARGEVEPQVELEFGDALRNLRRIREDLRANAIEARDARRTEVSGG
jgi:hypothetical protein